MNEIVYLNTAIGIPPECKDGWWEIEKVDVTFPPTKCKVTINKSVIVPGVYVWRKDGENICLYKDYHIERRGWYGLEKANCWPIFIGDHLVLEFKSDDFVIEAE